MCPYCASGPLLDPDSTNTQRVELLPKVSRAVATNSPGKSFAMACGWIALFSEGSLNAMLPSYRHNTGLISI